MSRTPTSARTRSRPAGDGPSPILWIVLGAIGLAAIIAVVAVALTGDDDDTGSGADDVAAEGDGGTDDAVGRAAPGFDQATATLSGSSLPPFTSSADDPAVGEPAPTVTGQQFDGSELTVPQSGRPTLLVFLAHWCPHCNAEVPRILSWADDGGIPDDVDVVAVATGFRANYPNYPASEWLEEVGWDLPVIADAGNQVAASYGLAGYPYWVVVDAQGNVVERRDGEQGAAAFDEMVTAAQGG